MMTAKSEPVPNLNQAKPTRSRRNKIIREIIIVLLGFSACGATIFMGWVILMAQALNGLNLNDSRCSVSNPTGIQEIAQFKLPPSAKLLSSGCGGFQGWSASASFEMNPSDLNTFLATTSVKSPLSSTNRPEKLFCHCDDKLIVTNYLYGEYKSSDWQEEVFIDTHNKNLYTVYFTVLGG